ncbi:hypothetical protein [Aquimarina algicola]|uniref:Uncharacterized protein n=1 Tax=Aquimarina algicola TaxID=2589995 RepID=A0A504JRZ6_9FLAO|nr:hypothetical protein [Aquimarina algicola]TPN89160.1 hypothetical protein FHK87_02745 [Aquimarina algicola]
MKNELSVMLAKLNSYRCEPCTSEMYEQYTELSSKGRQLKLSIDKLSKFEDDNSVTQAGEKINSVLKEFHGFQNGFLSYLSTNAVVHF